MTVETYVTVSKEQLRKIHQRMRGLLPVPMKDSAIERELQRRSLKKLADARHLDGEGLEQLAVLERIAGIEDFLEMY